jgi:formylglycine-generating enzyme required for sulfatase activity
MVAISPGTFQMGSPEPLSLNPYFNAPESTPVHPVNLTRPFWIGAYEVTQAQYTAYMPSNPSQFTQDPQQPVDSVSWNDAMAFCAALTVAESAAGRVPAGYQYRLPTEAEWEYCCRAGSTSEFHYGSVLLCGMAWFEFSSHSNSICSSSTPNSGPTATVGSYVPNAWGLYDMHGNVWEWCLDAWDRTNNYPNQGAIDPFVATGAERIMRGGSYGSSSWECRSAYRGALQDYGYNSWTGFRVVLAPVVTPGPLPPSVPLNMVPISPGTFQMGSPEPVGVSPYFNAASSTPVHAVAITRPFWIGAWEVTQQHYMALMSSNPSSANGDPQRPVESVTWNEAMAYCAALTVYESATGRVPAGYHYRLPTEAEWEYCCRAGSTSEFHYGSDLLCGMAWFDYSVHTNSSCSSSSPNAGAPMRVGSYVPNAWGLHDMHGNVWEWCLDAWDGVQGYPNQAVVDPFVTTGPYRVCRGGAFASSSWDCRSAQRAAMPESGYNVSRGFRVVLAPMIVP